MNKFIAILIIAMGIIFYGLLYLMLINGAIVEAVITSFIIFIAGLLIISYNVY